MEKAKPPTKSFTWFFSVGWWKLAAEPWPPPPPFPPTWPLLPIELVEFCWYRGGMSGIIPGH